MKITFKVFDNFEELRNDFENEQFAQTPEERLADVEFCRKQYCLMQGMDCSAPMKRTVEILVKRESTQENSPKKSHHGGGFAL